MSTRILTPQQIVKYAETRLFGSNVTADDICSIELHNAVLPSHLEKILSERYGGFERVEQENGREPIYFHEGRLFIPQWSGFGRRKRYESMIEAYKEASGKDLEFLSLELDGNSRKTNIYYENYAYDFVKALFLPKEVEKKVFNSPDMNDLTTVIFGPTSAVAKQVEVLEKGKNEYLDAQIISISGKKVINVGYVYADQAGIFIDKLLREYEALARKNNKKLEVQLLMFGRVGGLLDNMKRHKLVYPTHIIDEIDLEDGTEICPLHMHNIFVKDDTTERFNLNVMTVIGETYEQLLKAKMLGCCCTDMETRESVESINKARRRYNRILRISYGFVGHISDLPLRGDTLAEELDSDKGEQEAVRKLLSYVKKTL